MRLLFRLLACLAVLLQVGAFLAPAAFTSGSSISARSARPATTLQLGLDGASVDSLLTQGHSFLTATIDSDIENISNDNFGLVFAGGIAVMLGGVVSALIVGFILEKKNLYANIVADSYIQGAEDEEFWKGLSEEEKKKTQDLLQKLKTAKESGDAPEVIVQQTRAEEVVKPVESAASPVPAQEEKKEQIGMFSDYADEA